MATSLHVGHGEPDRFARDFQINDTVYRRLDPEYYAWLRSRMVLAKKAATAGQLDAAAFEDLRVRFNAVHEWAVEHFGEDELLAAVRTVRAGDYKPPVAEDEGPRVPVAVRAQIRRRSTSRQRPWPWSIRSASRHYRLAGNVKGSMPLAAAGIFDPRSRPCLLSEARRPDRRSHAPIHRDHRPLPSEVRQRFYNPDVDQPWIEENRRQPLRKPENPSLPSGY